MSMRDIWKLGQMQCNIHLHDLLLFSPLEFDCLSLCQIIWLEFPKVWLIINFDLNLSHLITGCCQNCSLIVQTEGGKGILMSINIQGFGALIKMYDFQLSNLFLWASHNANIFWGAHSAKSLNVTDSFYCVNQFQVLEIIHIDLILQYHNDP